MADPRGLYVIDASVMLKWHFYEENDHIQALDLKNDFLKENLILAVPSHAFTEVLNVMSIKKPDFAVFFLSQLLALSINEYSLNVELAASAVAIMKKIPKISFYDAVYHALAMQLDGVFVTADEGYYKKTKKLKNITLLKDL